MNVSQHVEDVLGGTQGQSTKVQVNLELPKPRCLDLSGCGGCPHGCVQTILPSRRFPEAALLRALPSEGARDDSTSFLPGWTIHHPFRLLQQKQNPINR